MAIATIGTVSAPGSLSDILKDYYIGPLQEQLNNEVMVLQMFEKAKISWAGRQGVVPVHVGRNSGVAFKAENTDLEAAGSQTVKRLTFEAAYLYGRFEVTGPAIAAAAKGGTASFIGALEMEMDKLKDDVRNQADRTLTSGGRVVGFICERADNAGANAWNFRGDFSKIGTAVSDAAGTLGVRVVDCSNAQLGALASYEFVSAEVECTAVSAVDGTITITDLDSSGIDAGYAGAVVISDQGVAAVDAFDNQPTGIYGNLGYVSLFGVDRGSDDNTATELQSVVLTTSETTGGGLVDLTLARMQETIDNVSMTSGMEPDVILMNPIDRAKYIGLITGTVQMNAQGSAQKGDGGFLGLSYAGIPIKAARHVDRGIMLFLNTKCWKLAVLEDGKFADLDGSVLARKADRDSWEGFYKWYYNHYCYRPNAQAVLTGWAY